MQLSELVWAVARNGGVFGGVALAGAHAVPVQLQEQFQPAALDELLLEDHLRAQLDEDLQMIEQAVERGQQNAVQTQPEVPVLLQELRVQRQQLQDRLRRGQAQQRHQLLDQTRHVDDQLLHLLQPQRVRRLRKPRDQVHVVLPHLFYNVLRCLEKLGS